MNPWTTFLIGFVPTFAAAVLGWVKWWHELREKRMERAAKVKAEGQLEQIRRRSVEVSPYFRIAEQRLNGIQVPSADPTRSQWLPPTYGSLLNHYRDEVDRATVNQQAVCLAVTNEGRSALEVVLTLGDDTANLVEPENSEAAGILLITYPYRPGLHGKTQTLEISFLRVDGARDVHRYEVKHGVRWLRRIDPV